MKKLDEVVALNKYSLFIGDHKAKATKAMSKHSELAKISEWWGEDKLPLLDITPVGIVMAYTNFHKAQPRVGCPSLPSLLGS